MSGFDPERYSGIDSPLHHWETRVKLISLFILTISIVIVGEIGQALAGLIIAIMLLLISRLPLHHILRFMKWPFIFLLPLVIILSLHRRGRGSLQLPLSGDQPPGSGSRTAVFDSGNCRHYVGPDHCGNSTIQCEHQWLKEPWHARPSHSDLPFRLSLHLPLQ